MADARAIEALTFNRTGDGWVMRLRLAGADSDLEGLLTPEQADAAAQSLRGALEGHEPTALDRDDGEANPWTEGP